MWWGAVGGEERAQECSIWEKDFSITHLQLCCIAAAGAGAASTSASASAPTTHSPCLFSIISHAVSREPAVHRSRHTQPADPSHMHCASPEIHTNVCCRHHRCHRCCSRKMNKIKFIRLFMIRRSDKMSAPPSLISFYSFLFHHVRL